MIFVLKRQEEKDINIFGGLMENLRNWYEMVNNFGVSSVPESQNELDLSHTLFWIAPEGKVYALRSKQGYIHVSWVCEYKNFLEQNYGYRLYDCQENDKILNKDLLIQYEWIRVHHAGNWFFDISSLSNKKSLKIIEDKMFNVLGFSDNMLINIYGYKERESFSFKWQEFIQSGETLVDFLKDESLV